MSLCRHYENQAWLWDVKEEAFPSLAAIQREVNPPLEQLEREHRAMRKEIMAAAQSYRERIAIQMAWTKYEQGGAMDYLVDAGAIVQVRGVSPRDSARLALVELGSRAQFPVTVHEEGSGKTFTFVREAEDLPTAGPLPKKSSGKVLRNVQKRARA